MSSTMSLGKVRCTPKGVWSAASAYEYLDILTYAGRSYIVCAEDGVPAGTSLDNTTYYQLLADVGAGGEILAATATIDNTYGTPTVEVVLGGTTHSRTFEFDFKHLLGNGIESIELYSTSGRTKTYRITYSSGGHFDFDVIDGSGISNIEKTGTSGLVDTYTITCQDGSTYTFTVTNGKSISTIAKTGTSGLVDTYTITYNDGSTDTFTVTNGQDYDLSVLAPDYDNTATYNVGDYANHDTGLYKCIYPITVAEEWNSAHWAGIILGEEIQNKANKTGYYDGMSVAGADNLITAKKETDTEPYNYRTTGGNVDVGSQENFLSLVGGTLALNQLVQNGNFENANYWSFTHNITGSVANNICTFTATAQNGYLDSTSFPLIAGHKYLMTANIKLTTGTTSVRFRVLRGTSPYDAHDIFTANTTNKQILGGIFEAGYTFNYSVRVLDQRASGWDAIEVSNVMCIDLTARFGTIPQTVGANSYNSIADYVYSLGNTNGIAWLYKYFPKLNGGYVPFANPNLNSVCCDKHITTGLNQEPKAGVRGGRWTNGTYSGNNGNYFIGTDSKIRVFPNTQYTLSVPLITAGCYAYFSEFDINGNFLRTTAGMTVYNADKFVSFTTSADAYFVGWYIYRSTEFTAAEAGENCFALTYDGEMNGVYEPYEAHTYDMGHDTLRGIYMLDSFGNLFLDPSKNDTKTPDGEITRRRGRVDLGTLTYGRNYYESGGYYYFRAVFADIADGGGVLTSSEMLCPNYESVNVGTANLIKDKTMTRFSNQHLILIRDDSYSTAEAFTTAMNGVYLEYPLAEETTESGTEYTELQKCHNWGTENLTDYEVGQGNRVVSIPVGHVTEYPVDLKAKLEASPDTPTQAGQYILGVDSSGASYIQYTDYGSRVTAVENGVSNLNSNAVRFDTDQTHTDAEKLQAQSNIGVDTTKGAVQTQLDEKAIPTGYYDEMGVGTAENLKTNLMEQNSYPFNFAPTGGLGKVIEASNRLFLRKVIYGSVVINQKVYDGNFSESPTHWVNNSGAKNISVSNGECSFEASVAYAQIKNFVQTFDIIPNHIYLCAITAKSTSHKKIGIGTTKIGYTYFDTTDNYQTFIALRKPTASETSSATIVSSNAEDGDIFLVKNVMIIDLTQWFGSTETADHIYEMADNGGIKFMQTEYPLLKDGYLPYNAGTLMSSAPSYHKNVTRNLFDVSTGKAELVGGQDYRIEGTYTALSFTDVGGNTSTITPDANGEFSIDNDGVLTVTGGTSSTMVFIHWDETMDDVPEEHASYSYPIDDTISGHGIFKFKTVNNVLTDELYVDGDELIPDGTFTKRWELHTIVADDVLDTSTTYENVKYYRITKPMDYVGYNERITDGIVFWNSDFNAIYDTYSSAGSTGWDSANNIGKVFTAYSYTSFVFGFAVGTTLEQAKAALVGKTMMYLLATPTTSQKDPYTEEQACDNWGTEKFNDAIFDAGNRPIEIPVGNVIDYPINLKDKVESQPDLPSEDGSYLLTKSGSDYTYTKFASSLPSIPTEDGTYTLKTTISSGEATLNWVADT